MSRNKQKVAPEVKKEALRRLAATDFRSYVRYTMPTYNENWHHKAFIDALQQLADGRIEKLLVTAPPRHGKSELISRRFPAWLVGGYWLGGQVLSASHTQDLADKMGRDVQRILREPEHREVFPHFRFGEKETAREFDVHGGGVYKGTGVGGAIAGRGANLLLIDDPVANREGVESKASRDKVWDWFNDDALTRLEPPGAVCVTATRWHQDDLSGRILAGPDAHEWHHIHLPAILETWPPPFAGDPRQVGDPLWAGRMLNPRAGETLANTDPAVLRERMLRMLERQRRSNAYGFQALFQGQPSAREGQMFRRDSAGTYQADPQRIVSTMEWVAISVDATFGASARADFVSMVVVGGRGPLRFLLDERTERLTYPQTKSALVEMARKWPMASILIERKANGQALIDDLRGKLGRVLPFDPQGSKETRASFAAEVFEAGQFLVPQAHYLPTLQDFLEDFYGFGSRPNDDRVDAVSQALLHYAGRADAVANLRRITDGYIDWSQSASWMPGGSRP